MTTTAALPRTSPPTNPTEALCQAKAIIAHIRDRGFKDGGAQFTDAQLWQAALDCHSADPTTVVLHLLALLNREQAAPTCAYMEAALAGDQPTAA